MTNGAAVVPTDEQVAVRDAAGQAAAGSLMIRAYAGCAKSTTLEMAGKQIKVPGLALAFNKRNADEMKPRFAGNFSVKTMNGLGFQALARASPGTNFTLDDKKLGKLCTQAASDQKINISSDQWAMLRQLVIGAMTKGIVPIEYGDCGLVPDAPQAWQEIADGFLIDHDDLDLLGDLAHDVLVEDIRLAKQGTISFDDQVYCSALLGGRFPKFPVVLVDEGQDLSPINHRMVQLSMADDARLVVVGDPKQACYAFRGADSASMDSMRALRPSWTDLPLATTFRCPKAVVTRQQEHVPGFRAWHSNLQGQVSRLASPGFAEYQPEPWSWGWGDIQAMLPEGTRPVVLCRNNAPLLGLAFKLIRQGVGAMVLGRDIGKGLVVLSRKIAKDDSTSIDLFLGLVDEWLASEAAVALANGNEEKVAGLTDRAECLRAASASGARDAGQLRQQLERLFSREDGEVTLSTIHRFKGLERDLVLLLDPWRIPSKFARERAKAGDTRQLEQEFNLQYVAETRTRNVLVMANLEEFK